MTAICYLNGAYTPADKTFVSVLDRGFLFGDGVYEVVPVYARRPLCWRRHIARLQQSLAAIRLDFDTAQLNAPRDELITRCADAQQSLYIQITRGVAAPRKHYPPRDPPPTPTVLMMVDARPSPPPVQKQNGIRCITREDFRWQRGNIKSTALLAAVLLADEAQQAGATETLLLRDGILTEGFSANVVTIKDGVVYTPVADNRILLGITYQLVLECAEAAGYCVKEGDITSAQLAAADEIWICSSTREMLPVTTVDDKPVGGGKVGEVYKTVDAQLQSYIRKQISNNGGDDE